jgi:hypothetical protein
MVAPAAGFAPIAASVAGSVISSAFGGKADKGKPKVARNTVSGNEFSDIEFLFDEQLDQAFENFTSQLTEAASEDRQFFKNVYEPFQQSLIQTNQSLLPVIQKNTTAALEANMKDLLGSERLKESFRENLGSFGGALADVANRFSQELDTLPTDSQRIGQAVSAVEQQFGQVGSDIKRQLASQGQNVSQATLRELGIAKAGAKAGAVAQAGEQARAERRAALSEGSGVFANLQQSQSSQLLGQVSSTQAGAGLTPQVGGVGALTGTSEATKLAGGLVETGFTRQAGQAGHVVSDQFTEQGVKHGMRTNEAGQWIDEKGEVIPFRGGKGGGGGAATPTTLASGVIAAVPGGGEDRGLGENRTSPSGGAAIGGVSSDRDTDRSGSGGFGGPI